MENAVLINIYLPVERCPPRGFIIARNTCRSGPVSLAESQSQTTSQVNWVIIHDQVQTSPRNSSPPFVVSKTPRNGDASSLVKEVTETLTAN